MVQLHVILIITFLQVVIFGLDYGSSSHADNLKNNFLLLGEAPTLKHWFTKFSINFSKTKAKFCLSLHYNGDNSHLFVNGEEICSLKPTIKLCLFGLIEQVFIELLSFSGSLATNVCH